MPRRLKISKKNSPMDSELDSYLTSPDALNQSAYFDETVVKPGEDIDGFTAIGQVRYSWPLSFWRKAVYFAALFALPAVFGAEAAFYAEPISDVVGPLTSVIVHTLTMKRLLDRRAMGQTRCQ